MEPDTYVITDEQWHKVNDALLAAISICSVHVPAMQATMINASIVLDEVVNGDYDEDPEDGFEE